MTQRFTIGRKDVGKADILIDDGIISGKHAELNIDQNGKISIRDLGSSNGTWVLRQGRKIPVSSQNVALQSNDKLLLGNKEFGISELISIAGQGRISGLSSSAPSKKRFMRCPECGSITPYGHPCIECGYDGGKQ